MDCNYINRLGSREMGFFYSVLGNWMHRNQKETGVVWIMSDFDFIIEDLLCFLYLLHKIKMV